MTYEELTALQYGRSKSFSEAQTEAMAAYCQAEHDLKQLQAENAKLRELMRVSLEYCVNSYCMPEDGCPLLDEHKCCTITKRARELGVDV